MKPESVLLKYIAKEIVYGGYEDNILKSISSSKINWLRLKNLLLYHEMAHFLYIILKDSSGVPEEYVDTLKHVYFQQLAQYMRLSEELAIIIKVARENNVPVIPIKGFSYPQYYYERFGFRPLVDIDLLIKKADLEKGIRLLEELGYKKYLLGATEDYWRKKQYHLEFIKVKDTQKIILELHWALDYERKNRNILPDLWGHLKKISVKDDGFSVMSPEDTLISLALHQRRFGKMLNLKYVFDVGILLRQESLDWNYIINAAQEGRFRASLFFLLSQAQIVLDKDLSAHLKELRIPFWQRKSIFAVIKKYTYCSHKDFSISYLYLACHLLLYDNITESMLYILKIPIEQFAKFYGLPLYAPKTRLRYRIRFVYIPYRLVKDTFGRIGI